ncbi:MAG: hypothetical protein KDE53_28835 [Caldilineaceae bacterium]|nr:hypothetical protein [Caldilineaceae bacterium]MCB0121034.1 hypothetical protein [Caldilineaceae bacterium]
MSTSTTVTITGEVAQKLRQLAQLRQQNIDTLLETLLNQAWRQQNMLLVDSHRTEPTAISTSEDEVVPRPGSVTEKLWGALRHGTQEELDEVFSYDYDYELSQR